MWTIIWIVIAAAAVGFIIYLFKDKIFKKKEGGGGPTPPSVPPSTPEGPTTM